MDKEESKERLSDLITTKCERLPFYINRLFDIIRTEFDSILNEKNIEKAYDKLLNEPKYGKILKQLEDRIEIYYEKNDAKIMFQLLNFLSKKSEASELEIVKEFDLDEAIINKHLYTLYSEHYLVRRIEDDNRYYSFKYTIVKDWWKINKA